MGEGGGRWGTGEEGKEEKEKKKKKNLEVSTAQADHKVVGTWYTLPEPRTGTPITYWIWTCTGC